MQPELIIVEPGNRQRATGLLIVPTIFGVNHEIEALMAEASERGILAATYDPFWRGDAGPLGFDADGRARAAARNAAFDDRDGIDDVILAVDKMQRLEKCNGRVSLLGICFGGRFAMIGAAAGGEGLVVWHGAHLGRYLDRVPGIEGAVSLHFGSADDLVPMSEVKAIERTFARRQRTRISVHEGAAHGFTHLPPAPMHDPDAYAAAKRGLWAVVDHL